MVETDLMRSFMVILYFTIVLIATTAGAIAGVGGGVIIKPVLDALGHLDLEAIGVLSSSAVLAMAVVSTLQRVVAGLVIDKKIVLLAIGGMLGGIAGKYVFYAMTGTMDESMVLLIQSAILVILMTMILFKRRFKRVCFENMLLIAFTGFALGLIASFLGIGGGPLNVAVLYTFLKLDIRKSAVGSTLIILLAQASKLTLVALDGGFAVCDSDMLYYMIAAGAAGGVIGSLLHRKMRRKTLGTMFDATVVIVIMISAYNMVAAFINIGV
jgi:hypothetical protein